MNTATLKGLMINDEGFAFDPNSGHTYNLNPTGLFVVNALKAGVDRSLLLEKLVERHEVDQQTADRDLEAFINELRRQRLIDDGAAQ